MSESTLTVCCPTPTVIESAVTVLNPCPDDIGQIANVIHRSYIMWMRGDLKLSVSRMKGLANFNRMNQTAVLSDIFNQYTKT